MQKKFKHQIFFKKDQGWDSFVPFDIHFVPFVIFYNVLIDFYRTERTKKIRFVRS